jgi:hypothetical protein
MGAKSHVLDLENYNPNHSDWYPGKHSESYRDGWDRIFGKKHKTTEQSLERTKKDKA